MRCLLGWLVALTASHALTWSGETHADHGRSAAAFEEHLSVTSFDHGHGDCGLVRVEAAALTSTVHVQLPLFHLERWLPSSVRVVPYSSKHWPDSHAPPV